MVYSKLKGRIREAGLTYSQVSEAAGISISAFNNKMTGKTDFTIDEVRRVSMAMDIQSHEIIEYFFDMGENGKNEDNCD